MIVTHKIHMDLDRRGNMPRIDAMQDDRYCRNLELSLYSGSSPWNPPEGTRAVITYRKPDGNGSTYDTMPDGSDAWLIRDNVLTVALAPQLCTVPGSVNLVVTLFCGDAKLSTFALLLDVARNPGVNAFAEDEVLTVSGFLPQVSTPAVPGQHLIITAVDEQGRITGLQAEDVAQENSLEQLQADWNQSDESAVDFIRNKPSIPDALPAYTEADYGSYLTPGAEGLSWAKVTVLASAEDHSF